MCHHHWPGDGIDLMRVSADTGELLVRLDESGCHYILTSEELARFIGLDHRIGKDAPQPELSTDETRYGQVCHQPGGAGHIHRTEDLHRLEETTVHFTRYIEAAVCQCNCHVMIPSEIVLHLFAEAGSWKNPEGIAEIGNAEMAAWYAVQESLEDGMREIGSHARTQRKARGIPEYS